MRFDVKIDTWIKLTFWGVTLMFVPILFVVPPEEIYIIVLSMVVTDIVTIPLLFWGYYDLRDEYLFIRLGIFKTKIKYDNIKLIKENHSLASSFALSSDRVEIRVHNKGYIMGTTHISPEDKEKFIFELRQKCKNLD